MFDLSRNHVRKNVEQPAWIPSELHAFELEYVKLNCVNVCHLGCFSCVLTFKYVVSVRVCPVGSSIPPTFDVLMYEE
jgi:hypothetical protein